MSWSTGGGTPVGDTHAPQLAQVNSNQSVQAIDGNLAGANNIANLLSGTTEEDVSTPAAVVVQATPNIVCLFASGFAAKSTANGSFTLRHYRGVTQVGSFTTSSIIAGNITDCRLSTILTNETPGSTTYKATGAFGGSGGGVAGIQMAVFSIGGSLTGSPGTCP